MKINADTLMRMVALGTACLCMILIVGGLLLFIFRNPSSPQIAAIFGTGSGRGVGAGFVGVLFILYKTVFAALRVSVTKGEK